MFRKVNKKLIISHSNNLAEFGCIIGSFYYKKMRKFRNIELDSSIDDGIYFSTKVCLIPPLSFLKASNFFSGLYLKSFKSLLYS